MTVNIHEAKTHFSKLLARVDKGEVVIIARAGKPVARLMPIEEKKPDRPIGKFKGKIWIAPDFDELPEEFLEAFYEGPVFPDTPSSKKPGRK